MTERTRPPYAFGVPSRKPAWTLIPASAHRDDNVRPANRFALVHDPKTDRDLSLDFRERVPLGIDPAEITRAARRSMQERFPRANRLHLWTEASRLVFYDRLPSSVASTAIVNCASSPTMRSDF